jgi:hypothetical protein
MKWVLGWLVAVVVVLAFFRGAFAQQTNYPERLERIRKAGW